MVNGYWGQYVNISEESPLPSRVLSTDWFLYNKKVRTHAHIGDAAYFGYKVTETFDS